MLSYSYYLKKYIQFFYFKNHKKEVKIQSNMFSIFMFSKHVLKTNLPGKFFYFLISKTAFKTTLTKQVFFLFYTEKQFLKAIFQDSF